MSVASAMDLGRDGRRVSRDAALAASIPAVVLKDGHVSYSSLRAVRGQRAKNVRMVFALSRPELADFLGVPVALLSEWEDGSGRLADQDLGAAERLQRRYRAGQALLDSCKSQKVHCYHGQTGPFTLREVMSLWRSSKPFVHVEGPKGTRALTFSEVMRERQDAVEIVRNEVVARSGPLVFSTPLDGPVRVGRLRHRAWLIRERCRVAAGYAEFGAAAYTAVLGFSLLLTVPMTAALMVAVPMFGMLAAGAMVIDSMNRLERAEEERTRNADHRSAIAARREVAAFRSMVESFEAQIADIGKDRLSAGAESPEQGEQAGQLHRWPWISPGAPRWPWIGPDSPSPREGSGGHRFIGYVSRRPQPPVERNIRRGEGPGASQKAYLARGKTSSGAGLE